MLIAQITDTHIKAAGKLAYRKVDTAMALMRTVNHLNKLKPDAVIISGDLTDSGEPEEYVHFRHITDKLTMPYYVVPGNHDERSNFRAAFRDHEYINHQSAFVQYVIDKYPLRLVGLDTSIPGESGGVLCQQRLDWLAKILAEEPNKETLIFMHHPPIKSGINHMDIQNCQNAEGFFRILSKNPQVLQVTCGHVHRSVTTTLNGFSLTIAPATSHSVALDLSEQGPAEFILEPPACQLFYLNDDCLLVSHLSYIGNFDGPYPFFDPDGSLID